MTLKTKFLIPTFLLVVLGMSIMTWVTYQRSTESLSKKAVEEAEMNVRALNAAIGIWVDGNLNEIITLSKAEEVIASISDSQNNDRESAIAFLQDSVSRHSAVDSILISNTSGVVEISTNEKVLGIDISTREYFKKGMSGQDFVSSPVFSDALDEYVFVIASPIQHDGKTVGVLSAGVKIKSFTKAFVDPLSSEEGYPFILAPDGVMLAHPDASLVGKLNVFTEMEYGPQIANNPSGTLDYLSRGSEKLMTFEKNQSTGWVVVMATVKDAAFADARSLGWIIVAMSAGVVLLLIVGIWLILSFNVLRPIGSLVKSAKSISDGDLNTEVSVDRKDEIGLLQTSIQEMLGNLKDKIGEAEEQGRLAKEETEKANEAMEEARLARQKAESARKEGMLHAAGRLEDVVAAVAEAAASIARQIEHSSQGAGRQSERMAETATAMEEMNATVIEVAKSAAVAADMADNARINANDGSEIVSKAVESISRTQQMALQLKEDMTQLGEQVLGIGQIMNVISDIADQTNLLALNAAIEAARAGEAGRGFAVVADEVRKLAEKTMVATKEVGDAIAGVQQGTRKNVDNVDHAVQSIDEATTLAGKSGEALTSIVGLVDRTTDQVRSIATASEEQSSATEEINHNVMDVNRISDEMAQSLSMTEQSLSGLEEQTRVLRDLIKEMQGESAA